MSEPSQSPDAVVGDAPDDILKVAVRTCGFIALVLFIKTAVDWPHMGPYGITGGILLGFPAYFFFLRDWRNSRTVTFGIVLLAISGFVFHHAVVCLRPGYVLSNGHHATQEIKFRMFGLAFFCFFFSIVCFWPQLKKYPAMRRKYLQSVSHMR